MPHLLLIDATLGAVAIMLAAWIVVRRGRSARPRQRPGEVAELASEGTARGEMTVVPGFSEGAVEPDPGGYQPDSGGYQPDPGGYEPDSGGYEPDPGGYEPGLRDHWPAGPEQAPSQVSSVTDADPDPEEPDLDPSEPAADLHAPDPGAPEPAGPVQVPSQVNGLAVAGPGAHAPAAEPGRQPGADGTVNSSGRVNTYYEGADQPVADYLAELGWSEESGARSWG